MSGLPPHTPASPQAIEPMQVNGQMHPDQDHIHDFEPVDDTETQQDDQPAPSKGPYPIASVPDQPYVTPLSRLPDEPANIDCPFCHKMTQTRVQKNDSSQTQLYGWLCCIFCGIIGVCVPYLCHWAQETDYTCAQCGNRVAHRPYEGQMQTFEPQAAHQVPSKYAEAGRTETLMNGSENPKTEITRKPLSNERAAIEPAEKRWELEKNN